MNKVIKFKEKLKSGDEREVIINLEKITSIEFYKDNYFSKPQYYIYLDNKSICSGSDYLNEEEFKIIKDKIIKAIGEENIL